jgi:uncharacterized protein
MPSPIHLYIDADACPVKSEVYRVAERFVARGTALRVVVVSNAPIAVPRELLIAPTSPVRSRESGNPESSMSDQESLGPRFRGDERSLEQAPPSIPTTGFVERVVVGGGMDEADNFIAERARRGDVVITADVPLAARAVKAGAEALAPNGRPFSEDAIGLALATRNLMSDLRSAGAITAGPKPFAPADRSRFLSALDAMLTRLVRAGFGKAS